MASLQNTSPKFWALWIFLAYMVMTGLNLLVNMISSKIPILKTGPILILILTFIVLVMLYSFSEDKSISRDELILFFGIVAVAAVIVIAIKYFVPELFSLVNNFSGGAFSIFG